MLVTEQFPGDQTHMEGKHLSLGSISNVKRQWDLDTESRSVMKRWHFSLPLPLSLSEVLIGIHRIMEFSRGAISFLTKLKKFLKSKMAIEEFVINRLLCVRFFFF